VAVGTKPDFGEVLQAGCPLQTSKRPTPLMASAATPRSSLARAGTAVLAPISPASSAAFPWANAISSPVGGSLSALSSPAGHGEADALRTSPSTAGEETAVRRDRGGSISALIRKNPTLSFEWAQVQFLLHEGVGAIRDSASVAATMHAAEESLRFLDSLERHAQILGMRKGRLSRLLLPFDANTAISDQATSASLVPLGSPELDGRLPDEERRDLVSLAVGLRRLIRVKLADCADIDQAGSSLRLIVDFFEGVLRAVAEEQCSTTALLREL